MITGRAAPTGQPERHVLVLLGFTEPSEGLHPVPELHPTELCTKQFTYGEVIIKTTIVISSFREEDLSSTL